MLNNIKGTTNDQVNSVPEETEAKNSSSYSYNPVVTTDLSQEKCEQLTKSGSPTEIVETYVNKYGLSIRIPAK